MRRIAPLASLGFSCLGAIQAAIAAPIYHVQELFPLPGHVSVYANAINAAGQVVGLSRSANGFTDAVLWSGATVRMLNPDHGPIGQSGSSASDINDLGQIVGVGAACEADVPSDLAQGACGFIRVTDVGMGPVAHPFSTANGYGNSVWLADPTSQVPLPFGPTCGVSDRWLLHISNAGYVRGSIGLMSPNAVFPNGIGRSDLCVPEVSQLFESGVAVTPMGYLYDALLDPDRTGRAWVVAPTCTGDDPAHRLGSNVPVSDDVKATICDLVASSYVRDRQQNASGQIISNVNGRASLYTPVSEPGNLALLGSALTCLAFARRKRAGR